MGNSSSSLPYTIGKEKIKASPDTGGWSIHDGIQKSDGMEVTVFQANKPTLAKTLYDKHYSGKYQIMPAYHHYQHCKKLRHPSILKVYATLDTDYPNADTPGQDNSPTDIHSMATAGDLIIVTEPCVPLKTWLAQGNSAFFADDNTGRSGQPPTAEQLAWGLQSIIEGLVFLHNSAKLSHSNVSPNAFYVTKGGDIKLWGFDLITPVGISDNPATSGPSKHFREWEQIITPNIYRCPERKDYRWEAISTSAVHTMDSYSLGILIQNVIYPMGIPTQLQKATQRLQTPSLKQRPRLQPLLRCPVFDTPYSHIQSQLNELHIQSPETKITFWSSLMSLLQNSSSTGIDKSLALYKILPIMKTTIITTTSNDALLAQDMYRKELLSILNPLFYIGDTYLKNKNDPKNEKFSKELSPIIAKLFSINDRGVRGTLLQRTSIFANDLDKSCINSSVFEPMCSGFTDSSPVLRELTLKSTMILLSHLSPPNMEKLSRYLVRLQSDTENSIRVNVIMCISKVAPHLTPVARDKMLLPAYIRGMKDPFQPCRLSSLQSITKSKELFSCNDLANKVLPSVMPMTLDSSKDVRKEAYVVINTFLSILKKEDERLAKIEELNPPENPQQQSTMTTSSSPMFSSTTAPTTRMSATSTTGVTPGGLSATKNINTKPMTQQQQQQPAAASNGSSSSSYMSSFSSWMSSSAQPTTATASSAPVAPAVAPAPPPVQQQQQQQQQQPAFSSLSLSDTKVGGGISSSIGGGGDVTNDGWDDVDDDDFDLDGVSGNATTALKPSPTTTTTSNNLWSTNTTTTKSSNDDDFFSGFDSTTSNIKKPMSTSKKLGSSGGKLMMPSKSRLKTGGLSTSTKLKTKPEIMKLAADKDDDTDWDDF